MSGSLEMCSSSAGSEPKLPNMRSVFCTRFILLRNKVRGICQLVEKQTNKTKQPAMLPTSRKTSVWLILRVLELHTVTVNPRGVSHLSGGKIVFFSPSFFPFSFSVVLFLPPHFHNELLSSILLPRQQS